MITAKDLQKHLDMVNSNKSTQIDDWLKEVVFNKFTGNDQGFDCPKFVTLNECKTLLEERGFQVTTHAGYQGSYVYISIPPQGE